MQTGAHFILIISLWIIGLVVSIELFLPDVLQTMRAAYTIDTTITTSTEEELTTEELVSYTPLGIFTLLGL